MDAVEYVKQRERMCNCYTNCNKCPAGYYDECSSLSGIPRLAPIVEQWAKEHPVKTRQSEFLKMWPNAKVFIDGILDFCPLELDEHYPCQSTDVVMRCQSCRCKFWMQEVE